MNADCVTASEGISSVDLYPATNWDANGQPHRAIAIAVNQKEIGQCNSVAALEEFLKSEGLNDFAYYTEFADGDGSLEFLTRYVETKS